MDLPFLIQLISQSILFCNIVTSQSLPSVDWAKYDSKVYSANSITVSGFSLGGEHFKVTRFSISDLSVFVHLESDDVKYFDSARDYFGRDCQFREHLPEEKWESFGLLGKKRIGKFNIFGTQMGVKIFDLGPYGCKIMLSFRRPGAVPELFPEPSEEPLGTPGTWRVEHYVVPKKNDQ